MTVDENYTTCSDAGRSADDLISVKLAEKRCVTDISPSSLDHVVSSKTAVECCFDLREPSAVPHIDRDMIELMEVRRRQCEVDMEITRLKLAEADSLLSTLMATIQNQGKKSGLHKTRHDSVKKPQSWPHLNLGQEYHTQEIRFYDLSLPQFVAGELEIIMLCAESKEKEGRLDFLKTLMYEAEHSSTRYVLNWYACWLREIESSCKEWGDDYRVVKRGIFRDVYMPPDEVKRDKVNQCSKKKFLFCHGFQKGVCRKKSQHWMRIEGVYKEVFHVCATCWLVSKVQADHRKDSESCPLYTEEDVADRHCTIDSDLAASTTHGVKDKSTLTEYSYNVYNTEGYDSKHTLSSEIDTSNKGSRACKTHGNSMFEVECITCTSNDQSYLGDSCDTLIGDVIINKQVQIDNHTVISSPIDNSELTDDSECTPVPTLDTGQVICHKMFEKCSDTTSTKVASMSNSTDIYVGNCIGNDVWYDKCGDTANDVGNNYLQDVETCTKNVVLYDKCYDSTNVASNCSHLDVKNCTENDKSSETTNVADISSYLDFENGTVINGFHDKCSDNIEVARPSSHPEFGNIQNGSRLQLVDGTFTNRSCELAESSVKTYRCACHASSPCVVTMNNHCEANMASQVCCKTKTGSTNNTNDGAVTTNVANGVCENTGLFVATSCSCHSTGTYGGLPTGTDNNVSNEFCKEEAQVVINSATEGAVKLDSDNYGVRNITNICF